MAALPAGMGEAMKKALVVVATLLAGIGVMLYPMVSNMLAERHGSEAIQAYAAAVSLLDDAERVTAWQAAEEYNQSLTGQPVHDPFIPGTGMALQDNYYQLLNADGIMGHLDVPRIGVRLPIYHGTSEVVLAKGIGHLEGSTLPIGGASRHSVLTGHTGLSHAKILTDLVELAVGDRFYIHVMGEVLAYQVDQIRVVEPEHIDDLGRVVGEDYVTLLTCTPYGVNSHRLLVRGQRVDYQPGVREETPAVRSAADHTVLRAAAITGAAMLVLIVAASRLAGSRRREEKS